MTASLSGCGTQEKAPVELKGDKFYGFAANAPLEKTSTTPYTVRPKESLSLIAKRYHVPMSSIASANNLKPPYILRSGQKLQIPAPPSTTVTKETALAKLDTNTYEAVPVEVVKKDAPPPPQPKQEQKIAIITKKEAAPVTAPTPVSPAPSVTPAPVAAAPAATPAAVAGNSKYIWPLKGPLLLHFGPGKGGYFNDGINIGAAEGTPISAAASGKVVYAGNELRGYGNLLIIKHDNGWLSAYAHQKDMIVKKGDKVTQGQTIGHVGTTGNVSTPQLHFGIRDGKNALNPEDYLPKS